MLRTPRDVSKEYSVPEPRLYELARAGLAPCVWVDGALFFNSKIGKWIRNNLYSVQEGQDIPRKMVFVTLASCVSDQPPQELSGIEFLGEYRIHNYDLVHYPTCVYFLYLGESLVYIGQSVNLPARKVQAS
jgi:hypothetical protein